MPVSSSASFNLTADQFADAAFARVKTEQVTGYDLRSARRAMQVLLQTWTNRGVNMWEVELQQLAFTVGTAQYVLAADTLDILDAYVRNAGIDYQVDRISRSEYASLPVKSTQSRVTQFWLDRQRDAPVINLYPAPISAGDVLYYYRVRRLRDVTGFGDTLDLPSRFIPAMISGLAYYLAREFPAVPEAKLARLKAEYEQDWTEAAAEDTDSAPLTIQPDASFYAW